MKNKFLGVITVCFLAVQPALAFSEDSSVAVADPSKIFQSSSGYKAIISQMEEKDKELNAKIKESIQNLSKERESLNKSKVAGDSKNDAKIAKLSEKISANENTLVKNSRIIDYAFKKGMGTMQKAWDEALKEVASKEKKKVIVAGPLWSAPEVDVTDKLIAKLNEKVPYVKLDFDEARAKLESETSSKK
ncbi:Outer membrane protein (OmpH-like) [Candidatus Fokinia solitaria]|uniref:Outer membrane protein (OmpH-like) n=1 Tax=Candidatus Fokinia solitaria TaxID=1802984 RepID=A0A2U8BRJ9_9RICK|nr:OmpH family outer membrane protein [Candidatus Fokinia solitaria]AWD32974.1 Outer membrane protein (OmpH-like) [Candidatus Fokinia solitaria]